MRLQVICITILQAAMVQPLQEVSGYLGDSVTLPSGANASWTLCKIEWSIFPNSTWIATYRDEKKSTERFYRYKGRLSLNTSTGDLTIHNLNIKDAMDYSVDLDNTAGQNSANKIKLTVTERLQEPTIETTVSRTINGGCLVTLECSSADQSVDFTWQVEPPNATVRKTQGSHGGSAVHVAFLNATQRGVKFTCTSSRQKQSSSSSVFPECSVSVKPSPTPPVDNHIRTPERCRYGLVLFGGVALGCLLSAVVMCCFGDQLKTAWEFIKGKLRPSYNSAETEA